LRRRRLISGALVFQARARAAGVALRHGLIGLDAGGGVEPRFEQVDGRLVEAGASQSARIPQAGASEREVKKIPTHHYGLTILLGSPFSVSS
jgi:hypothetical protein